MSTFIDPSTVLLLLLTVLGAGVRDLLSCLPTDAYWKQKNVAVCTDQLIHELDAVKPADVDRLIADLDADDPQVRDDATTRLTAFGAAAVAPLQEIARAGSPETVARAKSILASLRITGKGRAIRRLMAIRTLGERRDAAALDLLQQLTTSDEPFVGDYARAAVASIHNEAFTLAPVKPADRLADVNVLPARLDVVAQAAPILSGTNSMDRVLALLNNDPQAKARAADEVNGRLLKILESAGNLRLDALTWGFYAAPPGQPGNMALIARGAFDASALSALIASNGVSESRVGDVDLFRFDDDNVMLITGDGRVIFLCREAGGDLGLDPMLAALKTGAGDFSNNPDLPKLMKTVDVGAPLWGAVKMASGMQQISGPLGVFDTATLVVKQTRDDGKIVLKLDVQATAADAAKAKNAVENYRAQLKNQAQLERVRQPALPFLKSFADFAESAEATSDGSKASLIGTIVDFPLFPSLRAYQNDIEANAPAVRRR